MTNYTVIVNADQVKRFINWLPEITDSETYYVSLFARKKYLSEEQKQSFRADKQQCKRFVSPKARLFNKLQQLECPQGCYTSKDTVVPQQALTTYISINPRSQTKALRTCLPRFADLIIGKQPHVNVYQEAMSALHQSKSVTNFVDMDIDGKTWDDVLLQIQPNINANAVHMLDTRGGIHLLIDPNKVNAEYKRSWWPKLSSIDGVDITGDNLIPIPGCVQGDYVPTLYSVDSNWNLIEI